VRKVQKRILIGLSSSEAVGVSPWQRDRMGWHRFCSLLGFCCRVPPKLAFEMSARPRNGARLSQCYFYALSLSLSLWAHRLQSVPPNRRCWPGTRVSPQSGQILHNSTRNQKLTPRTSKTSSALVPYKIRLLTVPRSHTRHAFPRILSTACSSYPRGVTNPSENSPGPDLGQRRM